MDNIEPSEMIFQEYPYTVWNSQTGEIIKQGVSGVFWGLPLQVEDFNTQKLYIGAELSSETHAFNLETEEPYERIRAKSKAELTVLISRERDRRLELGRSFNGIYVTGTEKDIANLTNLALGAQLRIAANITTTTRFRDGNNQYHDLTPVDLINLWSQASSYVESLYQKSWEMKDMENPPQDYANDEFWPSSA